MFDISFYLRCLRAIDYCKLRIEFDCEQLNYTSFWMTQLLLAIIRNPERGHYYTWDSQLASSLPVINI